EGGWGGVGVVGVGGGGGAGDAAQARAGRAKRKTEDPGLTAAGGKRSSRLWAGLRGALLVFRISPPPYLPAGTATLAATDRSPGKRRCSGETGNSDILSACVARRTAARAALAAAGTSRCRPHR